MLHSKQWDTKTSRAFPLPQEGLSVFYLGEIHNMAIHSFCGCGLPCLWLLSWHLLQKGQLCRYLNLTSLLFNFYYRRGIPHHLVGIFLLLYSSLISWISLSVIFLYYMVILHDFQLVIPWLSCHVIQHGNILMWVKHFLFYVFVFSSLDNFFFL